MKKKIKKLILAMFAVALCLGASQGNGNISEVQATMNKPTLNINVDDAPVLIEDTGADTISASYNSRYYKVDIKQPTTGNWTVDISALNSNTNKSIKLYIPKREYDSINISVNNGMYSGGTFNAQNISAYINNGGMDFELDREFDGCVTVDAYNSIFNLSSLDRYTNFNVTMICDEDSLGAAPSYFDCDYVNGEYTYLNGTGSNIMNIFLNEGSVGNLE